MATKKQKAARAKFPRQARGAKRSSKVGKAAASRTRHKKSR